MVFEKTRFFPCLFFTKKFVHSYSEIEKNERMDFLCPITTGMKQVKI